MFSVLNINFTCFFSGYYKNSVLYMELTFYFHWAKLEDNLGKKPFFLKREKEVFFRKQKLSISSR